MTNTETQEHFDPKLIEPLLASYKKPEDLMGQGGILEQLTKALVEKPCKAS